jgi:hypothetical protein
VEYKTHLSQVLNLSLAFRQYIQTQAYFFKPEYFTPEPFMAVDSKLNSGYTNDLSASITLKGSRDSNIPFMNNENLTFLASFGIYHRHTDSPDWALRMSELYAYLISIGLKISI